MLAEYDFRGKKGVRGKYYEAMRQGYKTVINKSDGSVVVRETKMIALAPDVQEFFPDEEAVNNALRGLIALLPEKRDK